MYLLSFNLHNLYSQNIQIANILKTEETLKISLKLLIFKTATISLPFSICPLSTEGKGKGRRRFTLKTRIPAPKVEEHRFGEN